MRGSRVVALAAILLVPARIALAQEEMPVVVDKPVVEITSFTNWQEIKVTYTIGWFDGYEVVFGNSHPERMNFGDFEINPIRGREFIKINERKVGQANYADLVYYLRHISPKMKPLEPRKIPEQVFYFRCLSCEPGKPIDQLPLEEIKSPPLVLNYVTVLTPDADDIKDRIDFGSFSREAMWLKWAAILFFATLSGLSAYLLFRKPSEAVLTEDQSMAADRGLESSVVRRLDRAAALAKFLKISLAVKTKLAERQVNRQRLLADFSNELQGLILSFMPSARDSDTANELVTKSATLKPPRLARLVSYLASYLAVCDQALDEDDLINLERTIEETVKLAGKLKKRYLLWYSVLERWDSVIGKVNILKSRLRRKP